MLSGSRAAQAAASGMSAQQARLDILSNNLANVDTPGFRQALLNVVARPEEPLYVRLPRARELLLLGTVATGVDVAEPSIDMTQGSVRTTGRTLDAAILDDSFFTVSANGRTAYTRAGAFILRPNGTLADMFGNAVIGKSQKPITVPKGATAEDLRIGAKGEVLVRQTTAGTSGYTEIDRLQLARLDPKTVRPLGDRLYSGTATKVPEGEVTLEPEAIEGSNVNVVRAMAEMIAAYRTYEANARTVQALLEIESKTINELK